MAFLLSGSVITQSGTDANLSGLAGLTGVTVNSSTPDAPEAGYITYTINASTQVVVEGILTIDPDRECLILEAEAVAPPETNAPLYVSGTLNYGVARTGAGNTVYSQSCGLQFTATATNFFGYDAMYVASGGVFNWRGGVIRTGATLTIGDGGAINVDKGTFLNVHPGSAMQLRCEPSNTTNSNLIQVDDLTLDGIYFPSRVFTTYGFGNAVFTLLNGDFQPFNSAVAQPVTLTNFQNSQAISTAHLELNVSLTDSVKTITVQNPGAPVTAQYINDSRYGYAEVFRQLNNPVTDLDGNSVTYSYYAVDTNNGNRAPSPSTSDPKNRTSDQVYSGANQSGNLQENVLITTFSNNGLTGAPAAITPDDRTDANGNIVFRVVSYLSTISEFKPALLGLGENAETVFLAPDLSITETTKATVDAYTTIETSTKFYDYAKSYLVDNYVGQTATLVSRSGNEIDAGAYNVTIDATAASVFAFDGTTITIKASTYTGDMTTTGIITLANDANFIGTRTDANGTVAPPKVATVSGITAGSRLQIYNVTTATEVVNEVVSGTSYTATYEEGTGYTEGDTLRVRLTYTNGTSAKLPYQTSVIVGSSGWSTLANQEDDAVYNDFAVDGSLVTRFSADYVNDQVDIVIGANFNLSEFYAWWAYNLTTSDAINDFFGGITAVDQANFRINTSILSLYLDNSTNTNIRQLDNRRLYRDDDEYPVLDPTSGGGGIDVVWRNQILIAETIVNTSNVPVSEVDGATVVRTKDDLTPILFTFPIDNVSAFTKTKRINGGTSESITGAVTYLYELGGKYWYRLEYDASDRPSDEGSVQYTFAYNSKTAVINLHVSAHVTKTELDSAQASIEGNISALNNVSVAEVQTATANALTAYDAPTKAELDSAQNAIQTDIAAQNDISAADIRTELATELARLDATISSRLAAADYTAPDNAGITAIKDKTDSLTFTGANLNAVAKVVEDKTGYALTTAEREAIATQVESSILDENDGQKVLEAIVTAIGNQNIDELALVAAIRTDLERAGGSLDNLPTLSEIESSTVLAKEASITSLNNLSAAEVLTQAEAALTSYDAPTKAELDTAQASIESAITALNNLSTADILAQAEAALANYDPPTKAELDSVVAALNDISTADVLAQATAALTAYDAPTKTELDNAVAPLSGVATEASLVIINEGVKKASLLIPHTEDL